MAKTSPETTIDLARARAHWHARQGLATPAKRTLEATIAQTGWIRTLGGIDAYLAARVRIPGLTRAAVDEALAASRVQVLPAARGCIYLVPRAHASLALGIAGELALPRMEKELAKAGVPMKEVEDLAKAVARALGKGPIGTDGIRKALPDGAVRSLGERGKKLGISSPLPSALRVLELDGKIERFPESGRLDTERYTWRLCAKPSPRGPVARSRHAELARIFFGCAGPASAGHFAWWAGLGQKAARAAIEKAELARVAVEGHAGEAFVVEKDLRVLSTPAPASSEVALLPFEDNFVVLHGGPGVLVDARHHARSVPIWGSEKPATLGAAAHMSMRALLVGDRIAGYWEYDPDAAKVVWAAFDPLSPASKKRVAAAAKDAAAFIGGELGHAKSFSLDTTETIRQRAAIIAKM
ncbi:MAG: crosslink repair DNA glycosylase YcaQ family protein [Acidobacteriota bacterium]